MTNNGAVARGDNVSKPKLVERTILVDDDEHEFLSQCQELYAYSRGARTPVETFIVDLIKSYAIDELNPTEIGQRFEKFREDFHEAIALAADHLQQYPKLVRSLMHSGPEIDAFFGFMEKELRHQHFVVEEGRINRKEARGE